jgi:hypothetical protein
MTSKLQSVIGRSRQIFADTKTGLFSNGVDLAQLIQDL